jgi:glutamate synthase (NADPH/NADH) large chain
VIAEQILNNWDHEILHFVKIMPKALKEVLAAKNKLLLQAS